MVNLRRIITPFFVIKQLNFFYQIADIILKLNYFLLASILAVVRVHCLFYKLQQQKIAFDFFYIVKYNIINFAFPFRRVSRKKITFASFPDYLNKFLHIYPSLIHSFRKICIMFLCVSYEC